MVACLDQRQREAIGLRVRHKESGLLKMPGHGRIDTRIAAITAITPDVRHFLTSHNADGKKRIPAAVRGHRSVENLNPCKRDTGLWREDGHRHRRVHIAQNLALTRNALLAIIPIGAGHP
ncbi:MAG: hypothetical protein MUF86_08830 [Akkermansiaceae bacterium]|nr:hypothetical protein [Akkermansiaceae bacterium]